MVKNNKSSKKQKKVSSKEQRKDSKQIEKILEEKLKNKETPKRTEQAKEEISNKGQVPEEDLKEIQEPEVFSAPQQESSPRRKANPILEETFSVQDSPREENLEESLAGVETPKKKEDSKEFYSSVSYGSKQDEPNQKYGSPIQQGGIVQRKEDRGPITVGDIRGNQFITNEMRSDVKKEIVEYASQNPDEKYNVQNLERMDPTDLNRDRNKNPFLQDAERVEIKYE